MGYNAKVTICTQVYNAGPYLSQCIESVLRQTYQNFEYFIINNGSTDNCAEIIKKFEALDSRIRTFFFEENHICDRCSPVINEFAQGDYCATIDADDWWDLKYLAHLINFMEKEQLDLAITGTINHYEGYSTQRIMRKLPNPVILTQTEFAECYPQFWTFPSTMWGNVARTELRKQTDYLKYHTATHGADTLIMLEYMKHCKRIGIDSSTLYHYRIHPKGTSYFFRPKRLEANIQLYNSVKSFLTDNNVYSNEKEQWLNCVHCNSLITTVDLLSQSNLPADAKGAECVRIASHPLTKQVLTPPCPQEANTLRAGLLNVCLESSGTGTQDYFSTVANHIFPYCKGICKLQYAELLHKEPSIWKALIADDLNQVLDGLLTFVEQKKYSKQYNLGEIIQSLFPEGSLLHMVNDTRFIQKYMDVYCLIYQERNIEALNLMTGMLLEEECKYDTELFLTLYLSLAAIEGQVSAFLFGKVQLAQLLCREGRIEACRAILNELAEMGMEETDEIRMLDIILNTIGEETKKFNSNHK